MTEKAVVILFMVALSVFCWWMVLVPSSRRKFSKVGSDFWRLKKDNQEGWDGAMLAGYLVAALFFSIVTFVSIVVAIIQ